ncbi:hypothetical protein [Microtetraspora malaysiensis]|uniref:hypothetical protein n=1 Tax=Microtetraspora malaysiensis TaxID=161358 RepID=UPI003D8B9380
MHDDLLTFVADDDVWLAPVGGGRAWRFTADQAAVSHPRFSSDGTHIAWTSAREGGPEVFAADLEGAESERLTHWGNAMTGVRGWTEDGNVLAVTAAGHGSRTRLWAYAVPLDGGQAKALPYGRVSEAAVSGPKVATVSAVWREPSQWKRYRGGTAAKIWVDATGDGEFTRLFADNPAQHWSAMWVGERLAFLADTDGDGNLYSCLPDGSDLRQHTTHRGFYARHAASDGSRVVYSVGGELWMLESLAAEPYKLDITLGGPRPARAKRPAPSKVGSFAPDRTGRASVVEIRGTAHWLTHRDGPAGVLRAEPGVRVRLPRPSTTPAGPSGCRTPPARTRWRSAHPAVRFARWPPVSSAGCSTWPPRRTASTPRSPLTTGGSWRWTSTSGMSASWTAPLTATCSS